MSSKPMIPLGELFGLGLTEAARPEAGDEKVEDGEGEGEAGGQGFRFSAHRESVSGCPVLAGSELYLEMDNGLDDPGVLVGCCWGRGLAGL
ncbi:unnamed protein product [Diplocarpon coronariae]|nr:hypothetical protein JHW43_006965 [Diplocarpon mali]